ncbi:hypothetical protein GIB67_031579 [Kingdonia uniflora]|uniref:Uncharacterized protein n=1 Tax=Kingdonia uniflora TaxID=39325 RepID=A0A7J7PC46_9MAGN|nr:hypothetical protein GIB67_031579 [Kingdonia uniflora]
MQDLTMSSEEEEYDGIDDEEEFESNTRVGFKCQSTLFKLCEVYLILIEGDVIDWDDNKAEAGTSQARTSRGEVCGEGHLKVGPLLPDNQDGREDLFSYLVSLIVASRIYSMNFKAALDLFNDSSSDEEEEEDIDESSTDYSDDNIVDAIKIEILSNQAEIDKLE